LAKLRVFCLYLSSYR